MKTPNDHIFRLIKTMSAAEKRYFKIHFASDNSLMTELFNYLNKLSYYDETEIKVHFSNSKLAKNLKVYKVQLTDCLLKSLTTFRHKRSVQDKLRIGIEEVNILRDKQLFEVVGNKLKQLKKLAILHELHHYLLQLLQIELDLSHYLLNFSPKQTIIALNLTIKKIANVNRLRVINNLLEQQYNQSFFEIAGSKDLAQIKAYRQKSSSEDEASEFAAHYYQEVIQSYYDILLEKNHTAAIEKLLAQIQLFHNHINFSPIQIYPELYWNCKYLLLKNYIAKGKYAAAQKEISAIKSWLLETPQMQYCEFYLQYLEIEMAYLQGDFSKITTLEKVFLATIKPLKEAHNYEVIKGLAYLALIHILQHNFPKAHFYLRRLQALSKKSPKIFVQFFDFLELISHYKSKEILLLQNAALTFKRKKYGSLQKSELFSDLLQLFSKAEENKISFSNLQHQVKSYKKDNLLPLYQHFQLEKLINLKFTHDLALSRFEKMGS